MNTMSFQDLVKGQYGRKIAYVNYSEVTEDNVVQIAAKGLSILNWNRSAIRYLYDYYKGDQPSLYRTKTVRDDINNPVVENHAFEIVSFQNGQTYGEPVQCVSVKNDTKINEGVDKLNSYNRNAGKAVADIESGEFTSAVGQGYKAIQRTGKGRKIPYRIISLDPKNTIIVYSEITKEPLLSVQQLKDTQGNQYLHCFSETHEYKIKNSTLQILETSNGVPLKSRLHVFGDIPIVEYPNNAARLSDIELVITLLDGINEIQSNRVDDIAQKVQSFFKFVNCEIDGDSFKEMKKNGAIVVQSNAMNGAVADVGLISQELNEEGTQVAKEDIWENALDILAMPNREGNTGGDTAGAVQLRNGWDLARQRANLKDPFIASSDKRLNRVALNLIRQSKGENECPIDELDYDVHIVHSPTDNLLVKAEALEILLRTGIHPLVAIKVTGLWADAEKVYLQSKEYLDTKQEYNIDKMIEKAGVKDQESKAREILGSQKVG